jgi:hypothetical protein
MRWGKRATAPDGHEWRVRRRWIDRSEEKLRRNWDQGHPDDPLNRWLEGLPFVDFDRSAGKSAIALAVYFILLLALIFYGIFVALLLAVLFGTGTFARFAKGRPWTVEAIDMTDPRNSRAYPVKGFRPAGEAVQRLVETIPETGLPERP